MATSLLTPDLDRKALTAARDGIADRLTERYGPHCGLNADWNCRAWYVGPGEPNRTPGGVYILDMEESEPGEPMVAVARRWGGDDAGYTVDVEMIGHPETLGEMDAMTQAAQTLPAPPPTTGDAAARLVASEIWEECARGDHPDVAHPRDFSDEDLQHAINTGATDCTVEQLRRAVDGLVPVTPPAPRNPVPPSMEECGACDVTGQRAGMLPHSKLGGHAMPEHITRFRNAVAGRRIVEVGYLSNGEWPVPVLLLDDGTTITIDADDEGNGPGVPAALSDGHELARLCHTSLR